MPSADRLAAPPFFRRWRTFPGEFHQLFAVQNHNNFTTRIGFIGRYDVSEAVTAVVAANFVATGRRDARALNFEMATRETPLSIDRIRERRRCGCE